jgi:hypothetical protein
MESPSYFYTSTMVKKVEPPYFKDMVDPETGNMHRLDDNMLVVAPPDYPQLAEGLEIGAFYEDVPDSFGSSGTIYYLSSGIEGKYYYEWCEKLVDLVTKGKR